MLHQEFFVLFGTRVTAACPHRYMQPKTLKFALSVQSSHWKKCVKVEGGKGQAVEKKGEEEPKNMPALCTGQITNTLSFRRSGAEQW